MYRRRGLAKIELEADEVGMIEADLNIREIGPHSPRPPSVGGCHCAAARALAKELKQGRSSESVLADVLPFTHHNAVKSVKKIPLDTNFALLGEGVLDVYPLCRKT